MSDDEEVTSYVPPRYLFYPSESGAATSLSHDPNDDIAAAIAAVAAGESDLKMPSAAVEVQQVGREVPRVSKPPFALTRFVLSCTPFPHHRCLAVKVRHS